MATYAIFLLHVVVVVRWRKRRCLYSANFMAIRRWRTTVVACSTYTYTTWYTWLLELLHLFVFSAGFSYPIRQDRVNRLFFLWPYIYIACRLRVSMFITGFLFYLSILNLLYIWRGVRSIFGQTLRENILEQLEHTFFSIFLLSRVFLPHLSFIFILKYIIHLSRFLRHFIVVVGGKATKSSLVEIMFITLKHIKFKQIQDGWEASLSFKTAWFWNHKLPGLMISWSLTFSITWSL